MNTTTEELVNAVAALALERLRLQEQVARLAAEVERLKAPAPPLASASGAAFDNQAGRAD